MLVGSVKKVNRKLTPTMAIFVTRLFSTMMKFNELT